MSYGWDPLRRAIVICLAVSVIFALKELRKGFILQWATLLFFFLSAISVYGFKWIWLAKHMGIIANSFLSGVVWFTVLIDKPFKLQYARAALLQEQWYDEGLVRSCRFIAIFWGMLLLVPTVFNAFRLFYPAALPNRFYFYLSLFCIIIGISYTTYYKGEKRKQRESMGKPAVHS
jgi:hypothetical protein